MKDLLPEYAAGSLPEPQRRRVAAHLSDCADCRGDLAAWTALARAAAQVRGPAGERSPAGSSAPDARAVVRAVLARSAFAGPGLPVRPRRRLPLALVLAEARLVRWWVIVSSALTMALGVLVATAYPAPGAFTGGVLTLLAPVVGAVGIAGTYTPTRDPVYELTAATPTSPRLLLLIRVTLMFGYHLLLALAASVVVTAVGAEPAGLAALIVAWLGPLALLCALSVVLAVRLGPDIAVGAALGLWVLRVLADSPLVDPGWLTPVMRAVWSTSPVVALVSVALVAAAVILAGRGEPVGRSRATHLV